MKFGRCAAMKFGSGRCAVLAARGAAEFYAVWGWCGLAADLDGTAELALLKPDFESEIYTRAVDLKRHPRLPRRFVFAAHCLCIAAAKSRNFASV